MDTCSNTLTNADAERATVACIIMSGGGGAQRALDDIACKAGLTARDFSCADTKAAFAACQELAAAGAPADGMTVSAKSGVSVAVIAAWIDATPTAAHIEYYAGIVRDLALRRRLAAACEQGAYIARAPESGAAYAAAEIESLVQKAVDAAEIRTGGSVSTLLDKRLSFYRECLSRGYGGIPTGLTWLDDVFGGLTAGRVYIVSGGPGCGKTTLVRNIAVDAAHRGFRVAFATLELTPEELSAWMVCAEAKIPMRELDGGRDARSVERFQAAAREFSKLPISIEGGPMTASVFSTWTRRSVREGASMICLDYMQLLQADPGDKDATEERRVSRASAAVLSAALANNVPVLAIASESNAGTLRHSGQLSYDAAGHIRLIKREDGTGPDVQFNKIRHGAPMTGKLSLYFSQGKLVQTDPRVTSGM